MQPLTFFGTSIHLVRSIGSKMAMRVNIIRVCAPISSKMLTRVGWIQKSTYYTLNEISWASVLGGCRVNASAKEELESRSQRSVDCSKAVKSRR